MASSAFKSSTRRGLHAASRDSGEKPQRKASPAPRRSRSVSAAPRGGGGGGEEEEDYANTRTNPLFDCSASPSPESSPASELVSGGGGGVCGEPRGRSASVAPRRCSTSSPSPEVPPEIGGGGRRASRTRSVCGDAAPYRLSENEAENAAVVESLQSWRSRHPVSSLWEASSSGKHWEDRAFASSLSEDSTVLGRNKWNNGIAQSESCSALSDIGADLENVIWGKNPSNIPVKQIVEIPLEFDPDAAELVSGIGEHATKLKKEQIVAIPLEFDPDAAELISDIRKCAAKLKQEEIVQIPLEFDQDVAELVSDIREYATKLKQSHERARKLRGDLAVEEQREQELSRMLNNIVTVPHFTDKHKHRPRRKKSIERLKMSRCLAEEAMNYFEECVSVSTLDSTDFSSLEDTQTNSVTVAHPMGNSRFFNEESPSFSEVQFPTDPPGHHEESDHQTQCSISVNGSDVADGAIFRGMKSCNSIFGNNSSDDLEGFDTPRSRTSDFSFTHEPSTALGVHDIGHYIRKFQKGITSKEPKEIFKTRSSYCADDYVFQNSTDSMLSDMVTFKDRIQYGGLLICDVRTF